ncbi:MAG TPA: hypothetical protein VEY88_06800 [Archangium sp.]|nr:hypothetical protein [Archangium sp.]
MAKYRLGLVVILFVLFVLGGLLLLRSTTSDAPGPETTGAPGPTAAPEEPRAALPPPARAESPTSPLPASSDAGSLDAGAIAGIVPPEQQLDAPMDPSQLPPPSAAAPEERLPAPDEQGLPTRSFAEVAPAYGAMAENTVAGACASELRAANVPRGARALLTFTPVAQGRTVAATQVEVRPLGFNDSALVGCMKRVLEGLALDAAARVDSPGSRVEVTLTLPTPASR